MEISQHITIVRQEAKLLADAAQVAGLEADVPGCPGWNVRDLVRHLSEIHLWAAAHVAQPHDKPWVDDVEELTAFWPDLAIFWPEDSDLISWYLDTNANLVEALESAPADVESFTFLEAPSPLAMWARRQAHETAVHRFDAQEAAGRPSGFDPVFASDGVDELLVAFAQRKEEWPAERAQTMLVHAEDTDDRWRLTLGPAGISTVRGGGSADLTVTGKASDLYLVMWNRLSDSTITVSGDAEMLDTWHQNLRVRWS